MTCTNDAQAAAAACQPCHATRARDFGPSADAAARFLISCEIRSHPSSASSAQARRLQRCPHPQTCARCSQITPGDVWVKKKKEMRWVQYSWYGTRQRDVCWNRIATQDRERRGGDYGIGVVVYCDAWYSCSPWWCRGRVLLDVQGGAVVNGWVESEKKTLCKRARSVPRSSSLLSVSAPRLLPSS